MPYKFQKDELPVIPFTPTKYHDEVVMYAVSQGGLWVYYIPLDEVRFVPWDEVVEYAATSPLKELDQPKPEKRVREVPKPAKP